MISKTLTKYRALSSEVKSILGAYSVYALSERILTVFMGILVYTATNSLAFMALYFFVYFTACLLGFSAWGYLMSKWGLNMRWNHLRAFLSYILGFIWLWFFQDESWHYLVFAAFNGAGLGLFWLGHHTFEMLHTSDKDRDFYSAMLGTVDHMTGILGPGLATIIFFFSEKYFSDPLAIIFFIMPFLYFLVIPFLWNLPDYIPKKISKKEWKRLRTSKELWPAKRFAFVESMGWGSWEVFSPLIIIAALETYVNVGIFDTVLGFLAIMIVIVQGHWQNKGNRKKIFHWASFLLVIYFVGLFFWPYSPWVYILLGFYWELVYPVYGTVYHVISLKNIDQLRCGEGRFFAGLLYREWMIYLGRITSLAVIGTVALLSPNDYLVVAVGLFWILAEYLLLAYFVDGVLED
ncbi:MAG: MFS family permease [Oceanicoccus sp.]|jgi:MFS family permease